MPAILDLQNESANNKYDVGKPNFNPSTYRCHLAISREEDGTFSAVVLNLPGAGSCGDTIEEAFANAREAVVGVIKSYVADGADIPWDDQYKVPSDAIQHKWILVNA